MTLSRMYLSRRRLSTMSRSLAVLAIAGACTADAPLSPPDVDPSLSFGMEQGSKVPDVFERIISGPVNGVFDADGNLLDGPDTPLFLGSGDPFVGPDEEQVLFGDYFSVSGRARMGCNDHGTRIVLHLQNLIPNGVYTIWNAQFDPPFDGTLDNLIGIGALGPNDGSGNAFTADSYGNAHLDVVTPAGDLSLFGEVDDCLLDDETHLIAHYHTDGMLHGPLPGPGVDQFALIFFPPAEDAEWSNEARTREADEFERIISGPVNGVFNADGDLLDGPDTPLFLTSGDPFLGPDEEQILFGDYFAVDGRARMSCVDHGTRITMRLRNLIPNGVYTIWNAQFDPPFDGTLDNLIGIGALGPNDGSGNAFTADEWGRAHLNVVTPAGDLSLFGSVDNCLLDDETHLIGHYHTDGKVHGPDPGPGVDQFAFIFFP